MSTPPPPNPYGQPQYGQPQYGYPPAQPQPQPPAYGTPSPAYTAPPPPYGTPQPAPGQPAYGQPTPGQPPYGQPPYAQPYPQQQYPPRPTDSQRKSRRVRALLLLTGCLAALGLLMYLGQSSPDNAHANDCVHATGSNSIEKVSCTAGNADMIVLARFNGTTSTSRCSRIPNVTSSYWGSYGRRWHKTKYVLCLGNHIPGTPGRPA